MCQEDAPNGRIIHASGGRFSSSAIFHNEGVALGVDADIESFEANADDILGMDQAKMFVPRQRQAS